MTDSEPAAGSGGKRGRKQSRPDPAAGPVAAFACRLCDLKESAGDPSYDRMRGEFGAAASKSALSSAARGQDLPSWETTWEFARSLAVGVLGADPERTQREWSQRWEQARADAERARADGAANPGEVPPSGEVLAAEGAGAADRGAAASGASPGGTISETAGAPDDRATGVDAHGDGAARDADPTGGSSQQAAERTSRKPLRRNAVLVLAAVLVVLGGAAYALSGPERPIPGDASVMLGETIPDGTPFRTGASFVKAWDIKNVGQVDWTGRYLEQSGRAGASACSAPKRVWVPDVAHGETVRVSVPVDAGDRPGDCRIAWKMVDADGELFFPNQALRPVFFEVRVVG